jgi:hypothetical protein
MGQKPTSGYGIRIRQAAVEKGKLVVRVTERRPPPDAITAQVITAPFHVVAVKKTDLPVTWETDPQK